MGGCWVWERSSSRRPLEAGKLLRLSLWRVGVRVLWVCTRLDGNFSRFYAIEFHNWPIEENRGTVTGQKLDDRSLLTCSIHAWCRRYVNCHGLPSCMMLRLEFGTCIFVQYDIVNILQNRKSTSNVLLSLFIWIKHCVCKKGLLPLLKGYLRSIDMVEKFQCVLLPLLFENNGSMAPKVQ